MILIGLVIDTWTWVEYYETNNPEISAYIDGDEDLYVSSITLTEILRSLIPRVGVDEADECVEDILFRSLPVPVSSEIAIMAGKFKHKGFKGGTADAIILATAHIGNHRIVTGDLHFKDLPNVLFIKSN